VRLGLARKPSKELQHLSDSVTGPECIRTRGHAPRELKGEGEVTCKATT
jgi:hypothetical protein